MFLRRFTDFVLQSRVQAMAVAFLIAFIPLIGSISILIAALVTLRKGTVEGLYVLIASTAPYIISYYVAAPPPEEVSMLFWVLGILIISNVLTWILAVVLRQFSNWSITLEVSALLGIVTIAIVHLVYPDIQSWWVSQLTPYFAKTADSLNKLNMDADNPVMSKELQAQTVAVLKSYATGFLMVSVLFNALIQLVVARWWQAIMYNPGGLRKELYQIRLSHVSGVVFVAVFLLSLLGNELTLDILPVLVATFCVAGLSLIHNLLSLSKVGWVWLIVIYVGIVYLFPLSIIVVSIIALLDTGIDFRKRFIMKR